MDEHSYSAYRKENLAYIDEPAKDLGQSAVNVGIIAVFLLGLLHIFG